MQRIGLFTILALAWGCASLSPFTQETRERLHASQHDLTRVQYFIDRPILMEHQSIEKTSALDRRERVDERHIAIAHYIEIPKKTPVVALDFSPRGITVEVEKDLTFEFVAARANSQNYVLRNINGQRANHGGKIEYRGKDYRVYYGRKPGARGGAHDGRWSSPPRLLIDIDIEFNKDEEWTTIKGTKVK